MRSRALSLDLPIEPVERALYRHIRTGEELICGAVVTPHRCLHCDGSGRRRCRSGHATVAARCVMCQGEGYLPGHVICYQPDPKKSRTLKLTWLYQEFLEQFRLAAEATPDMFEGDTHG